MSDSVESELGEKKVSKKTIALYSQIISRRFNKYRIDDSITEFTFDREEISECAVTLFSEGLTKKAKVKNLGDVVYTFRHRRKLPPDVLATQPEGRGWIILGAGDAKYRFRLNKLTHIKPTEGLVVRKIPDATPQIIVKNALNDEQALLAKMRYNRLIDTFLGVTAYSLQNHLRTKVANYGQIEIDEIYVGVDRNGAQYVIPVQAKGPKDTLGAIQTIQDVTYCRTPPEKDKRDFTHLECRAVSAQLLREKISKTNTREIIALFELDFDGDEVIRKGERHYELVPAESISRQELLDSARDTKNGL